MTQDHRDDPQDPLERLSRALRDTAPPADPAARDRALARAMEKFDDLHQGNAAAARPNQDRPRNGAGFLTGVRNMFTQLTSKPALAATTSVAALCLGLFIILPGQNGPAPTRTVAPPPADSQPAQPAETAPVETASVETAPVETAQAEPVATRPAAPADAEIAAAGITALDAAAPDIAAPDVAASAPPVAEIAETEIARSRETAPLADMAAPPAPMATARPATPRANASQGTPYFAAPDAAAPQSATGAPARVDVMPPQIAAPDTEAYANAAQNPVKVTAETPVSTFSADVDTASYSVIRSSLMAGYLPPKDAVRIEEMVNYFPYNYPAPAADEAPFRASVDVMPTPWNKDTQLVRIGLQGRLPAIADRPPLNLVFLIDTSGSMQDTNKLPLLKQSLRMMLDQLRPTDQIAIVTYAGSAGEALAPTPASDKAGVLAALDRLNAGGSTAGAEGLELAYRTAAGMAGDGEVTRILLATDGDFNVGISDPDALTDYIAQKRDQGSYLSVLGFGRGNLDDATMQALAQNGNGQAAYIDTLQEARKVLVDQLSGALFPIADDVKLQVEWNPATVAEYRLIGYETRSLRREDFNNDKVDAGEIGAGTQVTAIYEVTAPGSDALLNDPLRYGTATADATDGELGFLRLRWKAPGEDASTLKETAITGTEEATSETRFAAAIAGFGQLLQGSVYLGDWGWDDAIALAGSARGDDPYGYRVEAVNLMRLAQSLDAN